MSDIVRDVASKSAGVDSAFCPVLFPEGGGLVLPQLDRKQVCSQGDVLIASTQIELLNDMIESARCIADYKIGTARKLAEEIQNTKRVVVVGEGSSMLLPGQSLKQSLEISEATRSINVITRGGYGALQLEGLDQDQPVIWVISNSGRTKEPHAFLMSLDPEQVSKVYAMTSIDPHNRDHSDNGSLPDMVRFASEHWPENVMISNNNKFEGAVAATKSVVVQYLVAQEVVSYLSGNVEQFAEGLGYAAQLFSKTFHMSLADELVEKLVNASTIHVGGSVAGAEIAWKSQEILGVSSPYAAEMGCKHGPAETFGEDTVLLLVDPPEQGVADYKEVRERTGATIIVISSSKLSTCFHTITVPQLDLPAGLLKELLPFAAGLNLLRQAGLRKRGLEFGQTQHIEKIGNKIEVVNDT